MNKIDMNRLEDIRAGLVDYFASLLKSKPSDILTDAHLLELGADSIMLVEAQRRLETEFGCRIEMQAFFQELNTIDRIAGHIARTAVPRAGDATAIATGAASPQPAVAAARPVPPAAGSSLHALFKAQLALVADTIEAQNRLLAGGPRDALSNAAESAGRGAETYPR